MWGLGKVPGVAAGRRGSDEIVWRKFAQFSLNCGILTVDNLKRLCVLRIVGSVETWKVQLKEPTVRGSCPLWAQSSRGFFQGFSRASTETRWRLRPLFFRPAIQAEGLSRTLTVQMLWRNQPDGTKE